MKKLLLMLIAASLIMGCKSSKKSTHVKQSFKDTAKITWGKQSDVHRDNHNETTAKKSTSNKGTDSAYNRDTRTYIWYRFDTTAGKVVPVAQETHVQETGIVQRKEATADSSATALNKASTDSSGRATMDSTGSVSYTSDSLNQINKTAVFSLWWLVFAGGMIFFVFQKIKLPFPRGTI